MLCVVGTREHVLDAEVLYFIILRQKLTSDISASEFDWSVSWSLVGFCNLWPSATFYVLCSGAPE